ncbi:hypothetical protein HZA98_04715 [Candidatus Woesearchaeota archaeon]|nr:hypothetical protein [Candidatus Woesearchaeota archaeon]
MGFEELLSMLDLDCVSSGESLRRLASEKREQVQTLGIASLLGVYYGVYAGRPFCVSGIIGEMLRASYFDSFAKSGASHACISPWLHLHDDRARWYSHGRNLNTFIEEVPEPSLFIHFGSYRSLGFVPLDGEEFKKIISPLFYPTSPENSSREKILSLFFEHYSSTAVFGFNPPFGLKSGVSKNYYQFTRRHELLNEIEKAGLAAVQGS